MTAIAIPRPSHLLRALRRGVPRANRAARRRRTGHRMFMATAPSAQSVWQVNLDEVTRQLGGR